VFKNLRRWQDDGTMMATMMKLSSAK